MSPPAGTELDREERKSSPESVINSQYKPIRTGMPKPTPPLAFFFSAASFFLEDRAVGACGATEGATLCPNA